MPPSPPTNASSQAESGPLHNKSTGRHHLSVPGSGTKSAGRPVPHHRTKASPIDGLRIAGAIPSAGHLGWHFGTDGGHRAVELADHAPSLFNAQPWSWEISDEGADLFMDVARSFPITDPDKREMRTGCGAAGPPADRPGRSRMALLGRARDRLGGWIAGPGTTHRPFATSIRMTSGWSRRFLAATPIGARSRRRQSASQL